MEMSFQGDPYRVLGLPAGADLTDIKRAYRILAKRYHPDSAGQSALPTFLAIQAAYEHLVHEPDRRRPGARPSRGARPAPDPAWRADPDRARAARDRWRARASGSADRPSSAGPSSTGRAAGPSGGPSARPGGRENAGSRPGTGGRGGTGGRTTPGTRASAARPSGEPGAGEPRTGGTRRGRATRKASLGSTSYDDVASGPLDANWEGAGWYGATSGTYWTLNPKEYADPRKHGPEYAARARRVREAREARDAGGRGPTPTSRSAPADGRGAGEDDGAPNRAEGGPRARTRATASERPWPPRADWHGARTRGSSRGWDWAGSLPPVGDGAAGTRPPQGDDRQTRRWDVPVPDRDRDSGRADPGADRQFAGGQAASARRWTDRLFPALLGWPPIGFAIVAVAGQLTGCDRYAAACSANVREPFGILTWAVQLAVVAILVAAPTVARLAASGTLALLAAAAPAAFLFAASGGTRDEVSAANALAVVLVVAWLAGLALAATGRLDLVDRLGRHAAGPPG